MSGYTISAKIKSGTAITGYEIMDDKGQKVRISREYLYFLVGSGKVDGVTATIYNESVLLKTKEEGYMKSIPTIKATVADDEKHTVINLVKQKNKIIGCHYDGVTDLIPRANLEQDAMDGKLTNVDAQRYHGKILLRGTSSLPVLNAPMDYMG